MKLKISLLLLFMSASISLVAQDTKTEKQVKITSEEEYERLEGKKGGSRFNKTTGLTSELKDVVIKGNKITTELWNYGSVCSPGAQADIKDLVWNGLGYGYEFGLLAGARVGQDGDSLSIISDSHVRSSEGDYDETGSQKWGWLPKAGYSDPNQKRVASLNATDLDGDGKPDSWPESWYSPGAGKYLWPAFLGDASTAPDEEVYFVIDDYTNYEFISRYQPFNNDFSKGGLGLDAEVRIIQFNNPLAEDLIFSIYQMTNASDKDLSNFYMGMFGDPHIGGARDYADDLAKFIPPKGELADNYDQRARSMVFGWDDDESGHGGATPGYFGWKFLESPSIDNDIFDNDDDGIADESPFNSKGEYVDGTILALETGIDNISKYTDTYGEPKSRWSGDEDGDWDPEKNDIGIDGIGPESVNYPGKDYGEGDGVPSQAWYDDLNNNGLFDEDEIGTLSDERSDGKKWAGSEPNFGFRDISESDQLGLTGFTVENWGEVNPKDDEIIWGWLTKPEIDPNQERLRSPGDNIFAFSTGPMNLAKGESQRFSMVILFGVDQNDLLLNAITSVRILEADYQFAQPPEKPKVTAVPGDGKVTLYWDAKSESSIDPLTSEQDFEGYKIYRSRDFNFSDVYKITDANGIPFLGQALFDVNTGDPAQFDLKNEYSGLSDVEYVGRGIRYDLGDNTGLVHEYVDSTVQNGIQYYYAVVAYDRGTDVLPPTETQSVIQEDATTGELTYDVNTLSVIPGPNALGIDDADAGIGGKPIQLVGNATGSINLKVLNDLVVEEKTYKIDFNTPELYNVLDSSGVSYEFTSKGKVLVALRHTNIVINSIEVRDASNSLIAKENYVVNIERGQIGGVSDQSLPVGNSYTITYRYYPVYNSNLMDSEDGNDVFEGIRVFVEGDEIGIHKDKTGFINNSFSVVDEITYPPVIGAANVQPRADWEFRWNSTETSAAGEWIDADTMRAITEFAFPPIAAPFSIWHIVNKMPNIYVEEPVDYLLFESNPDTEGNGQWDWGESVIILPQGPIDGTTAYEVSFSIDTTVTDIKLPGEGDIYQIFSTKPFEAGDAYLFETKKAEFEATNVSANLNDVYTVPNPYVGYSISENPGRTQVKRGEREIQFRNLPPQCTIRIYTLTGELVDTVEKDDNGSIAYWNLLSSEGMRISYGVYIFHVEAPGVGEKIGRFGVIK